jgi:TP53 regulating kinase-like protein
MVDAVEGVIGIEWIEGKSVRHLLPGAAQESDETDGDLDDEEVDPLSDYGVSQGRPNYPSSQSTQVTSDNI